MNRSNAAKVLPTKLKLVKGTAKKERVGSFEDLQAKLKLGENIPVKMRRPEHLEGAGLEAWERYIEPMPWIDITREAAATAFCDLWHIFRQDPNNFTAAQHCQLRGYMAELGLTDERKRFIPTEKKGEDFFD
jgi:hypothetical protein